MNKCKINTENLLFLLINIFLSFSLIAFLISEKISFWLSVNINHSDPVSSEQDIYYVSWILLFWINYIILKIFMLPIIYKLKKMLPCSCNILKNFVTKNHYRKNIFKQLFLLDATVFSISVLLFSQIMHSKLENLFVILIVLLLWGGGATTSYIIFIIYLKICKVFNKKQKL